MLFCFFLFSYYDQIASLEQKIPAQEVQVAFKWKDAFDRGSIFGGRISLTVPSLAYEKACILFNVGAASSRCEIAT
jgi:programmed cell death 6-interacting protein